MQKIIPLLLVLFFYSCGSENSSNEEEIFTDNESTEEMIQKGNVLFKTNCRVCHSLDKNEPTTLAPVLDSIQHHWPDKTVLARYIKNAPNMMQENKRSRKIYQEWKDKAQMPAFAGLSPEEINCIINYLYNKTQ